MAVWQDNLTRHLNQKEVLILHGNVRDMAYIVEDGRDITIGFTDLIRKNARKLGFDRCVFWGVIYDGERKPSGPMWSLERIEVLADGSLPETRLTQSQDREQTVLGRWLEEDIQDVGQKTMFVINYIDKLTPYSKGSYSKDTTLLITLVEKIIENITDNNRLVMIALQDTMLPLEYYTNSPRVAVLEVPLPDKGERSAFLGLHLSNINLTATEHELLSNITEGLFAKDLDNIARDILGTFDDEENGKKLTSESLRKIVNRYRLGTEEDPWTTLPISGKPKGLIDSAENWFRERVIGQDHAVKNVIRAVKKARASLTDIVPGQKAKPKAVFFFAGPTGVGKTYLAKQLADYLFDTQEAFLRFDMSEFKEEHTVSKFIGAPPGYVGYDKGGMLTNGVKSRPFTVILFDEIEQAHPKILDIFLQIFEDGRLTDSRGQTVFFTESIIVFTSNIGTRKQTGSGIDEKARLEGIIANSSDEATKTVEIQQHFLNAVHDYFMFEISRPELLGRIASHITAFNFLDSESVQRNIFMGKLDEMRHIFRDKFSCDGYRLTFDDEVLHYLMKKYGESVKKFGGREVVNSLDSEITYLVAEQKLLAEQRNQVEVTFEVFVDNGELRCQLNQL